jgi:AraC-like DNA-binding protein
MDRHDVAENITAEMIAHIHQEDLKIQDQFGCRGLTYWFDNKRKTAFCLIEAANKNSIIKMHNKAHGQVPHRVIEVEASIVESFLGRIEDPEKAKNTDLNIINDPAFRAIMVIQLNLLAPKSKDTALLTSSLQRHRNAMLDILNANEGKLVKQSENDFLVSFKSISKAVNAASEIKALKQGGHDKVKNKIGLKIGLSAGAPVTEKKLIFEDTIKLAERMCQAVKGDIVISSEVKELYNSENAKAVKDGKGICCLTQTDENFLNALFDYTDLHWQSTNLKIDDISTALGYSRSQLYRRMISVTGQSPNTFIKEYRLKEALKLLNKKTNNISQVAFDSGFTSQSYFSKCFQKKYGYLPSEKFTHS